MNYSDPTGRNHESLHHELMAVYLMYPEYSQPEYGGGDFARMVHKFAADDFYKTHFVAMAYLGLDWQRTWPE